MRSLYSDVPDEELLAELVRREILTGEVSGPYDCRICTAEAIAANAVLDAGYAVGSPEYQAVSHKSHVPQWVDEPTIRYVSGYRPMPAKVH